MAAALGVGAEAAATRSDVAGAVGSRSSASRWEGSVSEAVNPQYKMPAATTNSSAAETEATMPPTGEADGFVGSGTE